MSNDKLKRQIAYAIFSLRTQDPRTRITKQDLANEVGVSTRYIYDLENGKKMPTLDVVDRIARAFGLSLAEFCEYMKEQIN